MTVRSSCLDNPPTETSADPRGIMGAAGPPKMPSLTVCINISADDFLSYYRGQARHVIAECDDGRTVQFPASALQPFVTKDGVHGHFVLIFDSNNKLAGVKRAPSSPPNNRIA